jgi:alpha-galactosidase
LRADPPHRAARYDVQLANAGGSPLTIDAIYPLVVRFPRSAGPWRTLRARGGTTENFYPPRAYSPAERVVFGGEVRIESDPGGRSSNRHLPLLLAAAGTIDDAPGLFAGLEYSGEWFLTLRHVNNNPFLRGQLKMSGVALAAGEGLALPAAHVGFFAGGLEAGANALRRYLRDCICPTLSGKPVIPPVSYDHWFGIENDFDERLLRRQLERAAELGAEYWVHDAGWFEGGFPAGVGNWHRADPAKYPRGLRPLADAVRAAGMRFGLWFEVERAQPGTWASETHRQLFLGPEPTWAGRSLHLDLTRPDARDWAVHTIAHWIEELRLEWVRFDYNLDPAAFFRQADPTGKAQLAYYEGLYWVLDELMRQHPGLLVEACSGGGRRIDLGTLRRAHTCWISDQSHNPHICRYMQCRLARLLPGRLANSAVCVKLGAGREGFGDLDVLSRMCGALSFNGDVASWPAATARRMRKWADAYKQIRHLLAEDFHQLLPVPATDRKWDAVQFAAADGSESVLFAFRMAGQQGRAVLRPRGIDPDSSYVVTNLARPNRPRTAAGTDLIRKGLPIRLKPDAGACVHLKRGGGPAQD